MRSVAQMLEGLSPARSPVPSSVRFHPSSQDEDPYVRKTAAVCVAKLFDINGELVKSKASSTTSTTC